MNLYYYFNYFIYRYYDKKRDDIPQVYSFVISISLISINIILSICFLGVFEPRLMVLLSEVKIICGFIALSGFNYMTLYRNGMYKQVFADFKKNDNLYGSWKKLVMGFIIFTVLYLIIFLIIINIHGPLIRLR